MVLDCLKAEFDLDEIILVEDALHSSTCIKFVVHNPITEGLLHITAQDCKAILVQGTFDHILWAYESSDPDVFGRTNGTAPFIL